jgi:DNA-binding response OmpR family regulator
MHGPTVSRRVLVVEDGPDAAETLRYLLTHWGHAVRVARDGPAALALAPAFRPDVVLPDLGLPRLDGFEVAGRLRPATTAGHFVATPRVR